MLRWCTYGAQVASGDLTNGRLGMTSFIVPAGAAKEAAFDDELLPLAAAAYLARFKGLSRSTPTPTFGPSSAGAPNETSNHSKPNPPSSSCA